MILIVYIILCFHGNHSIFVKIDSKTSGWFHFWMNISIWHFLWGKLIHALVKVGYMQKGWHGCTWWAELAPGMLGWLVCCGLGRHGLNGSLSINNKRLFMWLMDWRPIGVSYPGHLCTALVEYAEMCWNAAPECWNGIRMAL